MEEAFVSMLTGYDRDGSGIFCAGHSLAISQCAQPFLTAPFQGFSDIAAQNQATGFNLLAERPNARDGGEKMDWINTDGPAILVLGIWIGYITGRLMPGDQQVRRAILDQQVERLIAGLSPQGLAGIAESLAHRRKIEAIRYFREETNAGLQDAKDAVEKMLRDEPPGFATP